MIASNCNWLLLLSLVVLAFIGCQSSGDGVEGNQDKAIEDQPEIPPPLTGDIRTPSEELPEPLKPLDEDGDDQQAAKKQDNHGNSTRRDDSDTPLKASPSTEGVKSEKQATTENEPNQEGDSDRHDDGSDGAHTPTALGSLVLDEEERKNATIQRDGDLPAAVALANDTHGFHTPRRNTSEPRTPQTPVKPNHQLVSSDDDLHVDKQVDSRIVPVFPKLITPTNGDEQAATTPKNPTNGTTQGEATTTPSNPTNGTTPRVQSPPEGDTVKSATQDESSDARKERVSTVLFTVAIAAFAFSFYP